MKKLVLLFLLLFSTNIYAQSTGGPTPLSGPRNTDSNWAQYIQSCAMSNCYRATFVTTNTMRVLRDSADNLGVFFNFGDQVAIKCDGNGRVVACMHQTTTATTGPVSADTVFYESFDTANTTNGRLPCAELTTTNPFDIFKVTRKPFAQTTNPTARHGTCATVSTGSGGSLNGRRAGAPCTIATQVADCGTTGTCNMNQVSNVAFMSLSSNSAASVCSVCRCDQ